VEAIDDLRNRVATYVRTHSRRSPEELLNAIRKDLKELHNIENRVLSGTTSAANGSKNVVILPGSIDIKVLQVGIPENTVSHLQANGFQTALQNLANGARTIIRIVPVRGWRR